MKNFSGKKIVITGAGSGMGRELALQLSALGAQVFITDINATTLNETAQQVTAKGGVCKQFVVDSGNEAEIFAFAKNLLDTEQYIDVLINNAGMALGQIELVEVQDAHLKKIIAVNMWGVINFTRAFLPSLISRPQAHLVNTSSVFGLIGVKTQVPYCTTKFAVRGFTEALRMELAHTNVVVQCVHPGGIKTNIARNGIHYKDEAKGVERFDKLAKTTAQQAAAVIIDGIMKNKEKILIGGDARMIDRMVRWFPVKYTSIFLKLEKRMMPE